MPPKPTAPSQGLDLAMGELSLGSYLPRPDDGTAGRPIQVYANMYKAELGNDDVWHYNVELKPVVKAFKNTPSKDLMWRAWKAAEQQSQGQIQQAIKAGAFDRLKNMYTPVKLSSEKVEVLLVLQDGQNNQESRFKLIFTFAAKLNLGAIIDYCKGKPQAKAAEEMILHAIQAINILNAQNPFDRFVAGGAQGRKFFDLKVPAKAMDGYTLNNGFIQSFRPTRSGFPGVQIDATLSPYIKAGSFLSVAAEVLAGGRGGGGRGGREGRGGPPQQGPGRATLGDALNPHELDKLSRIFAKSKFTPTHRKTARTFQIDMGKVNRANPQEKPGIFSNVPAGQLKFNVEGRDGKPDKMIALVDYYKQQYNVTITKPRLPCIRFGRDKWIPMEFVQLVEGNRWPFTEMTPEMTSEIIKVATTGGPPARKDKIMNWRTHLDYSSLPKLAAWRIGVAKDMMKVPARVLNPPMVSYANNQTVRPNKGFWQARGVKYHQPGTPMSCWAIVSFEQRFDAQSMMGFASKLAHNLNNKGCPVDMSGGPPVCISANPSEGGALQGVSRGLREAGRQCFKAHKKGPQMIVVILPFKAAGLYEEIKRAAAMDFPVPTITQCLHAEKINNQRGFDQYLDNVSLKIHAKLGGITHHVIQQNIIDAKTMLVGADVTHPPPSRRDGQLLHPSIAAVVTTVDGKYNRTESRIRLQDARVEIIARFDEMILASMQRFASNTGALPEKIIVFRDGVSEGQYSQVVDFERAAILKAADQAREGYKPKITFVICGKRHHMRFFAMTQQDADRTGNLPPGTVVDQGVTDPFLFDFYLQAHEGLQGTCRPTHYVVIADDNRFTADKMQALCNALCYTYARCTRAVSIVPFAYYADIICSRAREIVYNDFSDTVSTVSSDKSGVNRTRPYDPLELQKRFEGQTGFNTRQWYM